MDFVKSIDVSIPCIRPFVDSDDEDYDEKKFQDEHSDDEARMYQAKSDDDEEDELDMFMKGIEVCHLKLVLII